MADETVDLQFLARQGRQMLDEARQLRQEHVEMMRLLTATYEMARRVERRQAETRDDLELMLKMEIKGTLANLQTSIEASLSRSEDAVAALANRVEALEAKP
jgi:Mg2+ and Co2+ transporter CorA